MNTPSRIVTPERRFGENAETAQWSGLKELAK